MNTPHKQKGHIEIPYQNEVEEKPHFHIDEQGVLHKCFHKCKTVLTDYGFWLGVTVSFPLEHWLWHQWPFVIVTEWLGL